MTETDPKLPVKERRLLAGLLKFTFFVIAFFAVMVTILFNMGGSSDMLKQSLEKLVSDGLAGRPTRVIKLNRVSFFPSVGADFEKLEVKETMASDDLTVSVEKARFFVTFWSLIVRRLGVKSLYLEDVHIRKGLLGRNALKIEKLFIDHDKGTQKAVLRGNGMLEEYPWTASMDLEVSGTVGGYTYHIARNRNLKLELGDLRVNALLNEQISDYMKVGNFSVGMPEDILKGDLSASLLEGQILKIAGRLTSGDTGSILTPDILVDFSGDTIKATGKITSPQLDPDHIAGPRGPLALLNGVHELLAQDLFVPDKKPAAETAEDQKEPAQPAATDKKEEKKETRETERAFACRYDFTLKFVIDKTVGKDGNQAEGMEFDAVNKDGELTVTPVKGKVEPFKGPCRDLKMLAAKKQ